MQAVWFWRLWIGSCVVVVAWEYSQLWGSLVFDRIDLYATAVGALATVLLYLVSRRWAFRLTPP